MPSMPTPGILVVVSGVIFLVTAARSKRRDGASDSKHWTEIVAITFIWSVIALVTLISICFALIIFYNPTDRLHEVDGEDVVSATADDLKWFSWRIVFPADSTMICKYQKSFFVNSITCVRIQISQTDLPEFVGQFDDVVDMSDPEPAFSESAGLWDAGDRELTVLMDVYDSDVSFDVGIDTNRVSDGRCDIYLVARSY